MMKYYALFLAFVSASVAQADHFAGGTISTQCMGDNFHEITLQLFRNCSGTPLGQQTLNFANDCGVTFSQVLGAPDTTEDVSPLCADELMNSTCNGGSLVGYDLTTYRTTIYLSPCSGWRISWSICCRNPALNIQGTPGMYLEATLNNTGGACYTQPEFVRNSIPLVCVGQPVSYDGSATEPDGHTLRYDLIDARFALPQPLPVVYSNGFSGAMPYTGMEIDSITGTITFEPDAAGTIVTAVRVREYDSTEVLVGTVMRDLLFVVTECENEVPSASSGVFTAVQGNAQLDDDRSLIVCGEGEFCAGLLFDDSDEEQTLTISSNILDILPQASFIAFGTNPVTVELCLNSEGLAPGNYQFTVTATDGSCPVVGTQEYTFILKVGAGALSGENSNIDVCANADAFALIDVLGGDPQPGGTWTNSFGFPANGVFTPGSSAAGAYTYSVVSPIGCTGSAIANVSVIPETDPECLGLGLNPLASSALALSSDVQMPNRIWLRSSHSMDVDLKVLSVDGRVVMERRLQTSSAGISVDLRDPSSGTYVIRATDRNTGQVQALRLFVP